MSVLIGRRRTLARDVVVLLLGTVCAGLFSATATPSASSLAATASNRDLILSFPTTTTNYYGVQMCPGLSQSWTNTQAGLQGYGLTKTVTESNVLSGGSGFYRTVIQPQPVELFLPGSTAFAILGYDCGSIQEKVYLFGFDTNGYPIGYVELKTICSCGKDCSSPHSASATAMWDFAGNVIATNITATGASNPNFIATDVSNDIIYNSGAIAYLIVPIPLAPTNVTAIQSGDQFNISWMSKGVNPIAITSSTLTATPIGSTNPVLTATVTNSVTNGIITTLEPSTTYQITVASTTVGGTGPTSVPLSVTTEAATIKPSAPTNVTAVWQIPDPSGSTDSITVSWSAANPGNSPVDEYQVVVAGSDGGGTFTNTVSGTTLVTYFNGMDYIPNYSVTVQAHNAAGWGPVSTAVNLGGL